MWFSTSSPKTFFLDQLFHAFLLRLFFSPQIKIKYFLSQTANKQNFQKLTACPSLFAPHSKHQKKTANRPIVNLTLTIEVLLSSAPYLTLISPFFIFIKLKQDSQLFWFQMIFKIPFATNRDVPVTLKIFILKKGYFCCLFNYTWPIRQLHVQSWKFFIWPPWQHVTLLLILWLWVYIFCHQKSHLLYMSYHTCVPWTGSK